MRQIQTEWLEQVVQAITQVVGIPKNTIALHEPFFGGNEWQYVKECLDTGWVSSLGKYVDTFEAMLAQYTGVKRAIAVVNGTAALHMCLLLAEVQPEDEVIVQDMTFIATANAVTYCGAIPHFADISPRTLGLDPHKLAAYLRDIAIMKHGECINRLTGRRIKAVVPMHTFGHPVELDALVEVCETYNLQLVEDIAESLGSLYKGRHTGNWGTCAALSFNGNKVITTGGGGAILTNNESLGKKAKHITTTAKLPHKWAFFHDQTGYNYRLPNINAALGCAQMEQLEAFLIKKRKVANAYRDALQAIPGIHFFTEPEFAHSNYWLNVILLQEPSTEMRDLLLEKLQDTGILARPAWKLMHTLPMFSKCPKMDTTIAEKVEASLINLPSSVVLG